MIKEILYKLFHLEPLPCSSCEVLKMQLALANEDREKLLDLILRKNEPIVEEKKEVDLAALKPKHIPWNVKRQMLESEDRERARLLKDAEKLEKELEIAPSEKTG